MIHYDVKRLALILAIQAEITSAKLENRLLKKIGKVKYDPYFFIVKAEELRMLAYKHDEQL